MTQSVREVMSTNPISLTSDSSVEEAAQAMRQKDIGDVLVLDNTKIVGILTDRDIAVRVVAEGKDPKATTLAECCSQDIINLTPDDTVEDAIELMRQKAIRRLPIVDGDKPVGIVSIGDLAVERDPKSALADISKAPANE